MNSVSRGVAAILAAGFACFASPLSAQTGDLKVGMITTLSGPGSGLGIDVRDGFALALKDLGGTLGGLLGPELTTLLVVPLGVANMLLMYFLAFRF